MQAENKNKRIADESADFMENKLKKLIDEQVIAPKYKCKANEVIHFRLGLYKINLFVYRNIRSILYIFA